MQKLTNYVFYHYLAWRVPHLNLSYSRSNRQRSPSSPIGLAFLRTVTEASVLTAEVNSSSIPPSLVLSDFTNFLQVISVMEAYLDQRFAITKPR
jgi:hypothetical protein